MYFPISHLINEISYQIIVYVVITLTVIFISYENLSFALRPILQFFVQMCHNCFTHQNKTGIVEFHLLCFIHFDDALIDEHVSLLTEFQV